MKRKRNNDLVVLKYENGMKKYYTSLTRAGLSVGLASCSTKWAIDHQNIVEDLQGRKLTIVIEDGSEVPYKLINNN